MFLAADIAANLSYGTHFLLIMRNYFQNREIKKHKDPTVRRAPGARDATGTPHSSTLDTRRATRIRHKGKLSASPPYAMGGQEGSPSKSPSSPKDKGKRKKRRREGAPSSSKGAKGEGNGRTTTAARGAEALECYPMITKCACEQKHVQCFERAKGAANRCVFSSKIARDSWCLRLSRQSNEEQDRDASLDMYCHFACCDPFVYGLWLHSIDGAKWYYKTVRKSKTKSVENSLIYSWRFHREGWV